MKMKGGKMVNDCRPKNRVKEERERVLERLTKPVEEETIDEAVRVNENGNVYLVSFTWRGQVYDDQTVLPRSQKTNQTRGHSGFWRRSILDVWFRDLTCFQDNLENQC